MTSLAPRKCLPLPVFRSQLAECPANVRAQVDVVQIVLHDVCAVVVPGRRDLQVMVKHLSAKAPPGREVEPAGEMRELVFGWSRIRVPGEGLHDEQFTVGSL